MLGGLIVELDTKNKDVFYPRHVCFAGDGSFQDLHTKWTADGAELADDGRDLRADHNRQVSQYERLVESIDEITGYDANHQPIYKLPHEERMSRHRQATQMAESLAYQKARYA